MKQLEQFLADCQIHFANPLKAFREVKQSDRLFLNNAPRFSRYGHELHARELLQAVLPFLPREMNSAPENRPFPSRTASRR
jgi:hypothetical protein